MKIKGYIEGYYGKILNWENRTSILETINKLNFNSYFYAPKEDPYHRVNWRDPYPNKWKEKFKKFNTTANNLNISVIFGISPGLDFNFLNPENDFSLLVNKIKIITQLGVNNIAIMFDDIVDIDKIKKISLKKRGLFHGLLIKDLMNLFKNINFYVVPEIYSDEIFIIPEIYFKELKKNLPLNVFLFITGKKIVSKKINLPNNCGIIPSLIKNKIIVWDNLYCNDYCPRKLFVGKWDSRDSNINIMLNGTGLIETDKLLLNLMKIENNNRNWKKTILKYKIPSIFFNISMFFDKPFFDSKKIGRQFNEKKFIESIDYLLWKWKDPISLELYPYLLGLKQDYLIYKKKLKINRIRKTQTFFSYTNSKQK